MMEFTLQFHDVKVIQDLPLLCVIQSHICGQKNGAGDGLVTRLDQNIAIHYSESIALRVYTSVLSSQL